MRLFFVFPLAVMTLAAAGEPAFKPAPLPAVSASAAARPPEIPAAAVETGPQTYRYTGPDGRIWIYRNSPFGIMRFEEKPAAQPASAPNIAGMRATEDGDTVRFEEASPFGTHRWQRKKTELNETERAAWEAQRAAGEKQE